MATESVTMVTKLTITSPAFTDGGLMPSQYNCEGKDINPSLQIGTIPGTAKSLALIMEDPDATKGVFTHWVMWNIPINHHTAHIEENSASGVQGTNDFGKQQYNGPCPPKGIHRYFFKIYALSQELGLQAGASKEDLITAMKDYVVATGEVIGRYEKQGKKA